jgi:general stress protein 26
MSNKKNLYDKEAINKIKEMVSDITTCMFCTEVEGVPFRTRPMATVAVDDDGNLWFFSNKASDKNDEIKDNDTVQLLYAENSDSHFLTVTGKTQIIWDKEKINEYWSPAMKAYFKGGKDDPDISLLKVTPEEAHYWDTINGKMITLLKMATSAVTGMKANIGLEGNIKV